ncbi:hypothetical protein NDU88_004409 [Pleurodeles waltl]|uniref:Uncharacterized protein n=1 Tax=Pleurodeles waltl TaxID=8319 RepID=A0AAV7L1D0_PLEWA|nr:hypothetical protein NDU88_004409 [Pleurodeles waltl]
MESNSSGVGGARTGPAVKKVPDKLMMRGPKRVAASHKRSEYNGNGLRPDGALPDVRTRRACASVETLLCIARRKHFDAKMK